MKNGVSGKNLIDWYFEVRKKFYISCDFDADICQSMPTNPK
jgi:hypothetical protein